MKATRNSLLIFVAILGFVSCDSNRVYDTNISLHNETWHKDTFLLFEVDITDTVQIYNMYVNSRISGQYAYENMYLFVTTKLPNNLIVRDTLECILAEPDGRWLGKGFGDIWSNKISYKKHFRFPFKGNYIFQLEQAMREDELKHVLDAGIRIERAQ
ncbi:MAG TPA: gliding motility lipoprotein GldH [Marinilabiliales bacterium]|jgi:gliding motility-associated lipoprotein GldH|nr:gliding motility lipoprotein GldH [Marinilabiliales bacterium]